MDDMKAQPCANTRFVPASQLDFSRYAKNLAWLLDLKLQQAQELLSRIYGYEHLHELQQAMKSGLQPGPFWDDGPVADDGEAGLRLLEGMPGERSMRPAKVLLEWKREEGMDARLDENEAFIVELGLTDSPASHRDCVRRVKKYLNEEYSADDHGYPTGFWRFLAGWWADSVRDEQKTVKQLLEATDTGWVWRNDGPVTYTGQKKCVAMSRAVDVLGALGDLADHVDVKWEFGFGEDDLGWESMWSDLRRQGEWGDSWQSACAEYVFGLGDEATDEKEHDEERFQKMWDFVEWPSEAKLKECGVDLSFKDAAERVSQWRLGWMLEAVRQWQSSAMRIVSLTGWTSQRGQGMPWVADPDFVSLVMKKRREFEYEDSISLMDVIGTLIIERPDGERQIAGMVRGWHFSPVEKYYADFEQVDDFLENHTVVEEGWKVVRQYMTMRGITSMKDWVNADEGCAMTLLNMRLAAGFDNEDIRARLIRLVAGCFEQDGGPYTQSDDTYFDEIPGMEEFYLEEGDLTIHTPGLIVMSVKGLDGVGFSIADDEGSGRQIVVMRGGRRSNRRAERRMSELRRERGKESSTGGGASARRLLEKVVDTAIDVAVLDLGARDAAAH